jgi:thiamine transport system substrate-binding protein
MNRIFVCTATTLFFLISIVSHAQEKPKLTVYTYDAFAADWGPGPKIKQAFEAGCDCVLEFVATDSSIGILRKIQLEGESTKADIALGLDTNLTALAADTGLFAPAGGVPRDPDLPVAWDNPVFVPFDFGYFAFVFTGFSRLRHPHKSLLMDSVEVEQNRKQWIAEWLRAIGR